MAPPELCRPQLTQDLPRPSICRRHCQFQLRRHDTFFDLPSTVARRPLSRHLLPWARAGVPRAGVLGLLLVATAAEISPFSWSRRRELGLSLSVALERTTREVEQERTAKEVGS